MADKQANTAHQGEAIPDAAAQISGLIFAMILLDPHGVIVKANPAAESLLGKSEKQLLGQLLSDVLAPADKRLAERLREGDAALVARDVTIQAAQGPARVNLTISPLSEQDAWRVVTLNVTGRNGRAEDAALSPAIGAPAVLAHEIKNPLAAIKGAAQLASRKLAVADRRFAGTIIDEVDRIARLVDRMQQLGAQGGESLTPCNPHEAIRSAIAVIRAGRDHGVQITENFDPSLPEVLARKDAIHQVLINLIANACDAVKGQDNALVNVRTRYVSGVDYSAIHLGRAVRLPVEIVVTDNGPGVDPQLRDKVFEPFVSSKRSGQGLGLALVRKLMRDMHGSVTHERDETNGLTHFRLHLQIATQEHGAG